MKYSNFKNNNVTVVGNKCSVNGKTISIPSGSSVSIENGTVYVNGKKYVENGLEDKEVVHLTINVEGDVKRVDADCDVVINGSVKGNVNSGMSIDVDGNVDGDVRSGMSVDITGNQTGSVNAGMSVDIGTKVYK